MIFNLITIINNIFRLQIHNIKKGKKNEQKNSKNKKNLEGFNFTFANDRSKTFSQKWQKFANRKI